jgi:hypothetical protein
MKPESQDTTTTTTTTKRCRIMLTRFISWLATGLAAAFLVGAGWGHPRVCAAAGIGRGLTVRRVT